MEEKAHYEGELSNGPQGAGYLPAMMVTIPMTFMTS